MNPESFTILDSSCDGPFYHFEFTAYNQPTIQSFLSYTGSVVQPTPFGTTGVIYATNALLNKFYANINSNSLYGVYTVKVTASNLWTTTNSLIVSFSFNLTVRADCSKETITVA